MNVTSNTETDLGREVRAEIAKIIRRFDGCDLAGIKVSTLKRIDALLNPEPNTFRIPTERDTPAIRALEQARVDRLLFGLGA